MNWPQSCSTGDGDTGSDEDEPRVKVCWEVSPLSTSGDADGDGLLDGWERITLHVDTGGVYDPTAFGRLDDGVVALPPVGDSADAGINVESDDYPTTAELPARTGPPRRPTASSGARR
ncbi:hypothetical protein GCM10010495_66950 [Kitasatospora herbaricolor]|uniref:hypothetical protein n=1 Tax=Kitasatospora herbaricolor TaxID=68217 RepID=UPI00174A978B|nr:hypothetical protein [Kitasatospora herbaricolor]MDQ0313135.1 hypothetical protein [Kitasatospora herbaricolor]GGV40082.1 hypothetical protein GCM10010495_66950 [Kitasatospora herbaricolor]